MTRFPALHALLTGEPVAPSPDDLQQRRLALLPRQVGMPKNRARLREATHEQRRREVGR